MIFIALGTQKFQLNRLLAQIDKLIEENKLSEEVFAQIGNSTYIPKNYDFVNFLESKKFDNKIKECDVFICHGGVGSILTGIKNDKRTLVYPRLAKYDEHIDDHQLEISKKYEELGYIKVCNEDDDIEFCINDLLNCELNKKKATYSENIADYIDEYIDRGMKSEKD